MTLDTDPVPAPTTSRHWAAVTALVFAVLALIVGLVPYLGIITLFILGPLTLLFGIIGVVKTKGDIRRGRTMSWVALALGMAGIVAAVVWIILINTAMDKMFSSLYGSDKVLTGPGRNADEALPFGTVSEYPGGLQVTAAAPSPAPIPMDLAEIGGFVIGVTTTVTFTNSGADPIPFEPGASFYYPPDSQCREPEPEPGSAPTGRRQLQPGESATITLTAACYDAAVAPGGSTAPPTGETVWLRSAPDLYDTEAWFTGPLPAGARVVE
jgi:hypothetical protein